MHSLMKHFKVITFPDRAPSLPPKHHRHKRHDNSRYKRDEDVLHKLNFINQLLMKRASEYGVNTSADYQPEKLLDRVLKEVQEIKEPGGTKSNDCNMQGQWASEAAGGLFEIAEVQAAEGETLIKHKKAHDMMHNGFMTVKDWNTTITFPYSNSTQYIIVTGVDMRDKVVATFMGECRMCRKREVLQGNWLISSHSRDCESIGSTAKLISDVWRRDTIDSLKTQHLGSFKKPPSHAKSHKTEPKQGHHNTHSKTNSSTTPGSEESWTQTKPPTTKKEKPSKLHFKLH